MPDRVWTCVEESTANQEAEGLVRVETEARVGAARPAPGVGAADLRGLDPSAVWAHPAPLAGAPPGLTLGGFCLRFGEAVSYEGNSSESRSRNKAPPVPECHRKRAFSWSLLYRLAASLASGRPGCRDP